jgi:hypothetical protein
MNMGFEFEVSLVESSDFPILFYFSFVVVGLCVRCERELLLSIMNL